MRSASRCQRDVGGLVAASVERCQRELMVCYDLLVEGDGSAAEAVEADFFGVHRSLDELRREAQAWKAGAVPCALLRGPGKG